MDYMDVYTPYTLFFVVLITACIMISALFNAYIAIEVRKGILLWGYGFVQVTLLIWLGGKLMELVSPTREIINLQLAIQKAGILLLFPALAVFFFALWKRGADSKLLYCSGTVNLAVCACAARSFFVTSGISSDLAPLLAFIAWNSCIYWNRRSIFAELSDISIDKFMERLEDAIIIFDPAGKLMDYNQHATTMLPFMDKIEIIEDFYRRLNVEMVSGSTLSACTSSPSEPMEISLKYADGVRYYLHSVTLSKNKKNIPIATILLFHDVTEKTMLLHELEKKNAELDRLNQEMKSYIAAAHRLEDEKEKNRAFLQLQQTIGQSIAELLIGLEALGTADKEQEEEVRAVLSQIIEECRRVMSEIRESVEKLMPHDHERE